MAGRWWRDSISQQPGRKKKEQTNNPDVFSNAFIREGEERATRNTFCPDGQDVMRSGVLVTASGRFWGKYLDCSCPGRRAGEEAGFWEMSHLSSFIVKKPIALIKCPWDLFFYLEQIFYFSFFFKTFS